MATSSPKPIVTVLRPVTKPISVVVADKAPKPIVTDKHFIKEETVEIVGGDLDGGEF